MHASLVPYSFVSRPLLLCPDHCWFTFSFRLFSTCGKFGAHYFAIQLTPCSRLLRLLLTISIVNCDINSYDLNSLVKDPLWNRKLLYRLHYRLLVLDTRHLILMVFFRYILFSLNNTGAQYSEPWKLKYACQLYLFQLFLLKLKWILCHDPKMLFRKSD